MNEPTPEVAIGVDTALDTIDMTAGNTGKTRKSKTKNPPSGKRLGKPKMDPAYCRVQASVRMLPATLKELLALREDNIGRAIDKLVALAKDANVIGSGIGSDSAPGISA